MRRLLFAAARGARLQRLWFKLKDEPYNWERSHVAPIGFESDYYYRIHPEDEHLQYGPISSVLWEYAKGPVPQLARFWVSLIVVDFLMIDWLDYEKCDDDMTRSLFLLILAEALADEGL